MKLAFRLDANNQIGMGHAVRCSALAGAFMEMGFECVYYCRENREIREFAHSGNLGFMPVPVTDLNSELQWMRNALSDCGAVVIDSYFVSDAYIDALNRPGLAVVCYDDNALYEYSCDAVLNSNLHAPGLSFRFGRKKPELLLGGQYALLRREFGKAAPIEIRERAYRVFMCFGGSDLRSFTPKAINALRDIPDIEITVALGAMTACDDEVLALAGENVRVIKNPQSMPEIMRGCDIAVTAGGSTVYELAALGIPSVVVVQADNQELIAEYLDKNALMKCAGDWESADMAALKYETELLLRDPARRMRESGRLRRLVSRSGAKNAARRLAEIMEVNRNYGNT